MSLRHHGGSAATEPLLADGAGSSNGVRPTEEPEAQQDKPYSVLCWGCGLQLMLPTYTPVFKCGYCGAVSIEDRAAAGIQKKRHPTRCPGYIVVRDRITVTAVLALISVIIGGGVWAVFPVLLPNFDGWFILHSFVTALLSFNTLFNFGMCVVSEAGKVHPMPWGNVEQVRRGSLERFTFCDKCALPKPPGAHHCRQCRECVMEMDHHCPFIGNCVGANNQRYFLVFLVWAMMSCTYVVIMCIFAMMRLWPTLFFFRRDIHLNAAAGGFLGVNALKAIFNFEAAFSLRMMIMGYLILAATTTNVGIGFLLYQQLQLIVDGQSYIDSIQAPFEESRWLGAAVVQGYLARTLMDNVRRVFGSDHPLLWLMPRVTPPPGSFAAFLKSKSHNS